MFGLQELLIITAVILGLLFIPRMIAKRQPERPPVAKLRLSGKMRLAVAASAVYAALTAGYFQPWQKDTLLFLYIGIGPIAMIWLLFWVLVGFKKK
jgi:hypothetical protein